MLMLHDIFGNMRYFLMVGTKLTKRSGFPTYGIDLRNHGMSPHAGPHTYTTMANDVIRLLKESEREGEEKPILCGNSMGAKTAMMVALLEPDLVSKLIIIDNAPVSQPLGEKFHQHLLGLCHVESNYDWINEEGPKKRNQLIKNILRKYEKDTQVREFLKNNVSTVKLSRVNGAMLKMPVFNFKQDEVLAKLGDWPQEVANLKFEKPTLILKSERLNFIDRQDQFMANFPNNIYKSYNCSNLVADLPIEFIDEVSRFIVNDDFVAKSAI